MHDRRRDSAELRSASECVGVEVRRATEGLVCGYAEKQKDQVRRLAVRQIVQVQI